MPSGLQKWAVLQDGGCGYGSRVIYEPVCVQSNVLHLYGTSPRNIYNHIYIYFFLIYRM